MTKGDLTCDGCGQPASSEHITKRLQRLEWTTRYRPVHISTVLLGAFAPDEDATFLYAAAGANEFKGEAANALTCSGVSQSGKPREATLAEFQRAGYLLTYVLECPLNSGFDDPAAIEGLLRSRLPALFARVRRSLRPKRIAPISRSLEPILELLNETALGCSVVLDGSRPFALDGAKPEEAVANLRKVLNGATLPSR